MDHPSPSTQHPAGQAGGRPRLPHPAAADRPRPRTSAARQGATASGATASGAVAYRPPGRSLPAAALALAKRIVRPGHRLTGLGTGVVTTAITMFGGAVDALLFGGPGAFFGLVFVLASVAGALWVRTCDLAAAPISAPIAFAVALALTGTTNSGFLGHVMGTVTGLAMHTSWLYFGTLLSAGIVAVRRAAHRRAARR